MARQGSAEASTSPDPNRGGQRLEEQIRERDQSHAAAERLLDLKIGGGSISRLISGERKPGRELAIKIRDVYGIDFDEWDLAPKKRSAKER